MSINKLSAARVRSAKPRETAYRIGDGNGLYLQINPGGSKSWVQRLVIGRKGPRVDRGLGSLDYISLRQAREVAADNRRAARRGIDPNAVSSPTVEFAFGKWMHTRSYKAGTRSLDTLKNQFDRYVLPKIGHIPIDKIGALLVRSVVEPIFYTGKGTTARRVGGNLGLLIGYAISMEWRINPSPVAEVMGQFRGKCCGVKHHASVPPSEVRVSIAKVRESATETTYDAFLFEVLTVARNAEVRRCQWNQIDFAERVWNRPGEAMKMNKAHRVPLSDQAITVLERARTRSGRYVFGRGNRPLGDKTVYHAVRKAGIEGDVHGYRTSFSDWCRETNVHHDLRELAMAHAIGNAVERCYQQTDLLDDRRAVMQSWADHISE